MRTTSQKKKDRMVRISTTVAKDDDGIGFDRDDLFNAIQHDMMEISTLETHYEKEKGNTLDVTEYVEGKKTRANVPYVDDMSVPKKKSSKSYREKLMNSLVKHIEKWRKVKDRPPKRQEYLEKYGGSVVYAYEKIYGYRLPAHKILTDGLPSEDDLK